MVRIKDGINENSEKVEKKPHTKRSCSCLEIFVQVMEHDVHELNTKNVLISTPQLLCLFDLSAIVQ